MMRIRSLSWLLALLVFFGAACRGSNQSAPAQTSQPKFDASKEQSRSAGVRHNIGFATRQKFLDHYDKHGAEFGSISKEEYLRQAQELRDRPAGGDVLEAIRGDGVITRFDRRTGAFLAFNSDLTIRTYFRPNDGENYFRRQSKRKER
jgi:hypothetical protein